MRLSELRPELQGTTADGWLMFDCPFPACERKHKIRVAISAAPFHNRSYRREEVHSAVPAEYDEKYGKVKVWQASGQFPDTLTLAPSVDVVELNEQGQKVRTICWHGHIQNGEVT